MKKLRVFLAGAAAASALVIASPAPASASSCSDEPVNACVIVCSIGLSNKYTAPAFRWCYVV